ncbi:hypothetical protein TNCV_1542411 [Trichonephila clavipes]|nr:hypothetical protein TNCV_1542411 [Trichonephila clavipes]
MANLQAVTPKCLGGLSVDRDRHNAHLGSRNPSGYFSVVASPNVTEVYVDSVLEGSCSLVNGRQCRVTVLKASTTEDPVCRRNDQG